MQFGDYKADALVIKLSTEAFWKIVRREAVGELLRILATDIVRKDNEELLVVMTKQRRIPTIGEPTDSHLSYRLFAI